LFGWAWRIARISFLAEQVSPPAHADAAMLAVSSAVWFSGRLAPAARSNVWEWCRACCEVVIASPPVVFEVDIDRV